MFRYIEVIFSLLARIIIIIIIIIIHCLTSDLDPYWAHADYSLYTYREKTLLKKTPWSISLPFGTRL